MANAFRHLDTLGTTRIREELSATKRARSWMRAPQPKEQEVSDVMAREPPHAWIPNHLTADHIDITRVRLT